jgi:hypothetical protein
LVQVKMDDNGGDDSLWPIAILMCALCVDLHSIYWFLLLDWTLWGLVD